MEQASPSTLADLHKEHKERKARIRAAAVPNQDPPFTRGSAIEEPTSAFPAKVVTGKALELGIGALKSRPAFDIIIDELCKYFKVRKEDILSQRRINYLSSHRHMLAYMMYLLTDYSSSQIGERMDRDYSTVNYAIKKIQSNLPVHRKSIEELEAIIRPLIPQKRK